MRGIIGLANLGNTCYMNSAIQALRNCPEWTLFMTTNKIDNFITDNPSSQTSIEVTRAYQDLVKDIWAGEGPAYIKPMGFFEQLKKVVKGSYYQCFIEKTPQDAHEFLVWLLDQMYIGTQKKITIDTPSEKVQNQLLSVQWEAFKAWKSTFESQYSPLTDLIFGMFRTQYICSNCNTIHTRWETFNNLKIPLVNDSKGPITLKSGLESEFRDEVMEEFSCESCKGKHTATKKITIWRLPKVLIITLKRFTPMGTRDNRRLHCVNEPINLEQFFSPESQEESKKKNYQLFATIDHHGHHMGGHYTAQALNPVWKKWHLYDDESVHEINQPHFGAQTYSLMFR